MTNKWSKQDYEFVAAIIAEAEEKVLDLPFGAGHEAAEAMRVHFAEQFAYAFKQDNPRFKSHMFHRACVTFPKSETAQDAAWKQAEKEGSN